MTENIIINGWTFEETVKTAENLMEAENNMFKWDVLRHLRDFAENFKEELEQYRAIGTGQEIRQYFNENRKAGYEHGYSDGYKKGINKFIDKAYEELGASENDIYAKEIIIEIAEQLKGGAE